MAGDDFGIEMTTLANALAASDRCDCDDDFGCIFLGNTMLFVNKLQGITD